MNIHPSTLTGLNPLTGCTRTGLTVLPVSTPALPAVNIYDLEVACQREGLAQRPYRRNETARDKRDRAATRLERAKLAFYAAQRYQFGGFDAFMALPFSDRRAMLQSIPEFSTFGSWNARRLRPRKVTRNVTALVAKAFPDHANLGRPTRRPTDPGFRKANRHQAGIAAELFRPFPFSDALRVAEDAANYGRALERWADALHYGAARVTADGKRDATVPVTENLLLRPEVVAKLAPTGVLMTAPEEALLELLQEEPTPLSLTTANELAATEEQTFAHGERSALIPLDLQRELPALRTDVSFVPPKGRITELTKQYQALGHKREDARALARIAQAQATDDFRRTLDVQLLAAQEIVDALERQARTAITNSIEGLRRPELLHLTALVMNGSVSDPALLRVKADQHPDRLTAWQQDGDHSTWPALHARYALHATALHKARKAHAVKQLETLPPVFTQYQAGTATEAVQTLDGARLLLDQEGTTTPTLTELYRWVERQEQVVDRRVAYGRDAFVPDFIEVATPTHRSHQPDLPAEVEQIACADPFTLVIGSHIAEVPNARRMQTIRTLRHAFQPSGTVVAQDDLLVRSPSITFTTTDALPQGFRDYVQPAEHHLGRLNTKSAAYLLAHATEVRILLATPADTRVYFAGQYLTVDARHAALLIEAASLRPAHHTPEVIVTLL